MAHHTGCSLCESDGVRLCLSPTWQPILYVVHYFDQSSMEALWALVQCSALYSEQGAIWDSASHNSSMKSERLASAASIQYNYNGPVIVL